MIQWNGWTCRICTEWNIYGAVPLLCSWFSLKFSQLTLHSSSVRVRYWVSIVSLTSDQGSASITAVSCGISCFIGLRYKSTRLYNNYRHLYKCMLLAVTRIMDEYNKFISIVITAFKQNAECLVMHSHIYTSYIKSCFAWRLEGSKLIPNIIWMGWWNKDVIPVN